VICERSECLRCRDCGDSPRSRLRDQILGSDLVGSVGLRLGDILCRLERILIQSNLHGALPVAGAEPDLSRAG